MIRGVGHIGILVKNIDHFIERFCHGLDIEMPQVKDVPERQMKVAVIPLGAIGIELIEDYSRDGAFAGIVRDKGNTIHHFALVADQIETDIHALISKGIDMVDREPKVGLRGKKIAFIQPDCMEGIPIELTEA